MSDTKGVPTLGKPGRTTLARVLDGVLSAATIAVVPILAGLGALKLAQAMANGNVWAQALLVWLIGAAALPGMLLTIYGLYRILRTLRR